MRTETALPGVCLIASEARNDVRGAFLETYHQEKFAALGIHDAFVQDNMSISVRHTLRGLHAQVRRPQAKLCCVLKGEVLDVVADIRRGSPTFGRWVSTVLSGKNSVQVYVPAGFAHGFLVLSESAVFFYKCSDFYDAADEIGVAWNDSQLKIDWGVEQPLLSEKDATLPHLREIPPERLPRYERGRISAPVAGR